MGLPVSMSVSSGAAPADVLGGCVRMEVVLSIGGSSSVLCPQLNTWRNCVSPPVATINGHREPLFPRSHCLVPLSICWSGGEDNGYCWSAGAYTLPRLLSLGGWMGGLQVIWDECPLFVQGKRVI